MNMRPTLSAAVALSGLLALAGPPVAAQEAALSLEAGTLQAVSVEASTTSLARSSAVLVPLRGTVSGRPESVAFSGRAQVTSRLVRDPHFGRPSLLVSFDLSGVSGVGSSSGASYAVLANDQLQRRLAGSHVFEIVFPFNKGSSTDLFAARSGVASFALDFDVETGTITSAAARVATPAY